jgi:hypothetical protein
LAQHSAGAFGIPLLERALVSLPLPADGHETLLVADFGAARASLAGDVYADVRAQLLAEPIAYETRWRVALLRITRARRA